MPVRGFTTESKREQREFTVGLRSTKKNKQLLIIKNNKQTKNRNNREIEDTEKRNPHPYDMNYYYGLKLLLL